AAISFARYFPNREEDRAKGKRTPVTILGERRATKVFAGLFLAPFPIGVALLFLRGGIVWMIVLVLVAAPVLLAFHLGAKLPRLYEFAIALTIASHLFVGFGLILDFAFGLQGRGPGNHVGRRHPRAEGKDCLDRSRVRCDVGRVLAVVSSKDGASAGEGQEGDKADH